MEKMSLLDFIQMYNREIQMNLTLDNIFPEEIHFTYSGTKSEQIESNKMSDINNTLQERGNRYGEFVDHADVTQALKVISNTFLKSKYKVLSAPHQEALDMIYHKIGRILNGDPNYKDSWHDIAGYAKLGEDACQE